MKLYQGRVGLSVMNTTLHFLVARSRTGWSVNLEADRICDHASVEAARACAALQARIARRDGERVSLIDLSRLTER